MPQATQQQLTNAGFRMIRSIGPLSVWERPVEGQDTQKIVYNGTVARSFRLGRFSTIEEALFFRNLKRIFEIIVPTQALSQSEIAEVNSIASAFADPDPDATV